MKQKEFFFYNDENLEEVKEILIKEKEDTSSLSQVYTMVQINSPCEVTVTKKSRNICVAALLR